IVSFDAEGAKEIVHGGENGFVVPRGDENALTESLAYLTANPKRAKQMGLLGRRFIGEEYDKEIMVRRIDKLYRELLARPETIFSRRNIKKLVQHSDEHNAESVNTIQAQHRQFDTSGLN
ncbi:MAG TPA: hypothetical protein PKJ13_11275, partial [bacterium]|nr:hypothetical protein [bacterium]